MEHLSYLAASAATALLTSVWQGILLAGVVALCLRLVPRLGAAARAVVWLAVFLLVAALDVVSLPASPAPPTVAGLRFDAGWALALACLWAALSLLRLIRLLAGAIRLHAIARRATPLPVPPAFRNAVLCASPEVDRPGVFGFFAPRILLPAGLAERLSPVELHAVLLHEQEHLRRRDVWINLLQKTGLALLPLNPVLAWVERRLCRERELACDDHVLHHTRARKAYAACLAQLAEHTRAHQPLALALGLAGRGSELARRIQRILNTPRRALGPRAATTCSALLLAALLGGAAELARCPRLVSFGAPTTGMATAVPAMRLPATQVSATPRVLVTARASATDRRPRLIQAVASTDTQPLPLRIPAAAHTPRRARVYHRNARSSQRWLVLTPLTQAPTPALMPVRFVVPLAGYSGLSYAAVPTGTGWIVLQL